MIQQEQELATRIQGRRDNRKRWVGMTHQRITTQIPVLFQQARFSALHPQLQAMLNTDKSLYLWGGVGSGKTHTAMTLVRREIVTGKRSINRVNFEALLGKLRNFERPEDEILTPFFNAGLIVLDDIGQTDSDYARRILFRILDYRVEGKLQTVVTSNLSLENLRSVVGDRNYSRLQTFKSVKLNSSDKRMKR